MHRTLAIAVCVLLSTSAYSGSTPARIPGFSAAGSAAERALEAKLDAAIDPAELEVWMRRIAARPHHLGSPWDEENARYMLELFRSWGYDAHIETFEVLFPTPKSRRLELLSPTPFTPSLGEPAIAADSTSGQKDEQLPTYNAYSIDGDVTGDLVYVNYGVPEDYDTLARHGVDVAGKIVIARYGKAWRGIKPKVAAEHGATGCILYSDPMGDGYWDGEVYPEGGYRPPRGVQRGSVMDMPIHPGDPLTPGYGATADAKRLARSDAKTLTKIPVLPISYADARPFLEALGGEVVPPEWRGALPLTYRFGPGPARVRLAVAFDWKLAKVHDVIATLLGRGEPERWVLRGNHHDAWVNGATDPVSGLVALLAEARAVGKLAREGWRPRRTIVYAAWDGEEPGLLGSTEWAEAHADELRAKAVAYVNSDSTSRGFLEMEGSHTLQPFLNAVARDVPDPERPVSVLERLRAHLEVEGGDDVPADGDLPIGALGSGSDYSAFLQHLGVPSLNVGFGGEGEYGQYHSIYDSIDHFVRFMDPGFAYGAALARLGGRATLRLAEAEVLPFDPGALVDRLAEYVEQVEALADDLRKTTAATDRLLDAGAYALAADPTRPSKPPERKAAVPHLNFAPLENAIETLRARVAAYSSALAAARDANGDLPADRAAALDAVLVGLERALTSDAGLPGRPWYRHLVYAPGFYTGYGVKTLPAVRETIEARRFDECDAGVAATAQALGRLAAQIDRATRALAPEAVAAR